MCRADIKGEPKSNTDPQSFVVQSDPNLGDWVGSNPYNYLSSLGFHKPDRMIFFLFYSVFIKVRLMILLKPFSKCAKISSCGNWSHGEI